MQKLADGHDTEVGSSLAWLWSRCVAARQAGAEPSGVVASGVVASGVVAGCVVAGCVVAGWLLAAGPGGAGEPLHPVTAPMSRRATHALIRRVAIFTGPRRGC